LWAAGKEKMCVVAAFKLVVALLQTQKQLEKEPRSWHMPYDKVTKHQLPSVANQAGADSLMFSCAIQLMPSSLLLYNSATVSAVGSGAGADRLAATTCDDRTERANLLS
jgi:hypothetical protein